MTSQDQSVHDGPSLEVDVGPVRRMSEEQFVAWCDEDIRAEWVDGEIVMMSPTNVEHSDLSGWLASLVRVFIEQHDLGVVVQEVQVRFAEQRRRRVPDISFVAENRRHILRPTHIEGPPDLVVEIVSPDSGARDWRDKYLEYEAAGVREYWVIDPMSQHAEAYALGRPRKSTGEETGVSEYHRIEERQGVIASTVLAGFWIKTAWLWPQTRPKVLQALQELGAAGSSNR